MRFFNTVKNVWKMISNLERILVYLLIFSLFTTISVNFVFANVTEIFYGGAKTGKFLDTICLAYITSFIFYFFNVFIKEQSDKRNLYEFVQRRHNRIMYASEFIINSLQAFNDLPISSQRLSDDMIKQMCSDAKYDEKIPKQEAYMLVFEGHIRVVV